MIAVLAAISRTDVANYVSALFYVYLILIIARILLSWVPRLPYNRVLSAVVRFIHDVTDPYLNVFRRVIPPVGGGGVALDLSPMLAVFLLIIVRSIVVGLIQP